MHEKILPRHSLELLNSLERDTSPLLDHWILAGGTGLALHKGHRLSDDLDFFRTDDMDVRDLHDVLAAHGSYETLQEAEHTLTVRLHQTKLSFFRVKDPLLFEGTPYRFCTLADPRDIALMKLAALAGRGSRKDFIDLYILLQEKPSLETYFDLLPKKFGANRSNPYHMLRSLTFFEDAEREPLPRMLVPFDWEECKAFFVRQARAIVLP